MSRRSGQSNRTTRKRRGGSNLENNVNSENGTTLQNMNADTLEFIRVVGEVQKHITNYSDADSDILRSNLIQFIPIMSKFSTTADFIPDLITLSLSLQKLVERKFGASDVAALTRMFDKYKNKFTPKNKSANSENSLETKIKNLEERVSRLENPPTEVN